jgi:hypothetical protein
MTGKLNALPHEQFILIWNSSSTLDAAVGRIQSLVGKPCPRWAVMARALACRKDGVELKRFEEMARQPAA